MQVGEKYLFGDAYKNYSYEQRRAMYENELNMTMYGTCGNMNDPHLDGPVKGSTALDVYKKALETTDSIPAQFKGAAYDVFSGNLKALMGKDFASIPDMNLEIGFSNGELQDSVFNPDIMRR